MFSAGILVLLEIRLTLEDKLNNKIKKKNQIKLYNDTYHNGHDQCIHKDIHHKRLVSPDTISSVRLLQE